MKTNLFLRAAALVGVVALSQLSLAAKECRKYTTKMKEMVEKKVIDCKLNKKKVIYSCREKDKTLISAYYFNNLKDFIRQNKKPGLQKVEKVQLPDDEWVRLEYDDKGRMKAALMTGMQFYYDSWDEAGRNTGGTATAVGQCRKMKLSIIYNDKTRTESHRYSGGEDIKEKGCEFFNGLVSDTIYDKNGNTIKTESKSNGALISKEDFKILKTKTVCH